MRKEVAIKVLTLTTVGSLIFGYVEKKEADKQRALAQKHIELLEQAKIQQVESKTASKEQEIIPEFEVIASRTSVSLH
jgi:hypothetical protein